MADAQLPHYSQQLADFVASIRYEDLDEATVEKTKQCVLDYMGVAMAGSMIPQAEIWMDLLKSLPECDEATAWSAGFPRFAYRDAAGSFSAATVAGHLMGFTRCRQDLFDLGPNRGATGQVDAALPNVLDLFCQCHRDGLRVPRRSESTHPDSHAVLDIGRCHIGRDDPVEKFRIP